MEREVCLLGEGKGNSQYANKHGKYTHIFYDLTWTFKEKKYAQGWDAGSERMHEKHFR